MSIKLGQYEIRPSKLPRNIMHRLDHLMYDFEVTHCYGTGFFVGGRWTENDRCSEFNERHEKRYPKGSYEILVRRYSDTGLRPRPKGSKNAFGDDERSFQHADGT